MLWWDQTRSHPTPGNLVYENTPAFFKYLTKDQGIPSKKYTDTNNAPPYNLSSESWKESLKNNMPEPGDVILYRNATLGLTEESYTHAAVVVEIKDGWPLVVDQSNGNKNIGQPHKIDSTNSTDIWNVVIIFLNKWELED